MNEEAWHRRCIWRVVVEYIYREFREMWVECIRVGSQEHKSPDQLTDAGTQTITAKEILFAWPCPVFRHGATDCWIGLCDT